MISKNKLFGDLKMPQFGEYTKQVATGSTLDKGEFTFPEGGDTSEAIKTWGRSILELYIPAGFLGTELTILSSHDGVTYVPYYNIAGEPVGTQVITANLPCAVGMTPIEILGCHYVKFQSSVAETAEPIITYTLGKFK